MRISFLILLATILSLPLLAQDFDKSKMDDLFALIDKHEQGMGSISLYKDGREVYSNSIGVLDLTSQESVNSETAYRIGSISKTFTACIIMKLIEDKQLKLTTPLSRYFPKVKNSFQINIEHLLRHRSGIYNFTNTDEYLTYMEKPLSRDELLIKVKEFGSSFDPDEESGYSNSNYVLLTMIAEKVTKKSYSELVEEIITKPLGLNNTYVGSRITTEKNEAKSFKKIKKWENETETDMSIPLGAGAIVSSPSDVNTFLHSLLNDKIVSQASREKMMKIKDDYGIGLVQIPFYDKKAFGHNGGIDGFQSMAYHFPKEGVTVTYLSNGVVYPINDIMIDVLSNYFGKEKELPEFLPVMKLNEKDLDQYLGTYASDKLPIELVITKDGGQLIGQATGQQSFPLDAVDIHKFKFDPARLAIEFLPEKNKLMLKQGGVDYMMTKK